MRFDRGGEPYGAVALPPRRQRSFWLGLARVAPLVFASSVIVPWGVLWCRFCYDPTRPSSFVAFEGSFGQYPWLVPWGWLVLISSLTTMWSLTLLEPTRRATARAVGLTVGAFALALPLAMALGIYLDPAGIFRVEPAFGLWLAVGAYLAMAVSSVKARPGVATATPSPRIRVTSTSARSTRTSRKSRTGPRACRVPSSKGRSPAASLRGLPGRAGIDSRGLRARRDGSGDLRAWLCDFFVLEAHRGKGLATWLMEHVMAYPDLQGPRNFLLATRDAHGLYEHLGFRPLAEPSRWMAIRARPASNEETA